MSKTPDNIDHWGIATMQSAALRRGSWIEAIALGYTLLEIQLRQVLLQNIDRMDISENEVEECDYLKCLSRLAYREGLLPEDIHQAVMDFNRCRNQAIHRLATFSVERKELEDCAKSVLPLEKMIQDLWLPFEEWDWVPADD